ncbi:hypothetical protein [Pseudodesulfovibrio indicus]|uniref:Transcriptional regulator n=1 Tax=Pseudodesulfovibrio indicus TaxID=1716143 RepID=A0A140D8W3_9BACT|nr:hypothetical protein [Pseudodesulfovibrio indicus]AMK09630.1 hypothetical protein AWY79_00155 [Pseudodesulfovibrio indicus]TDT86422.1 hypothetical protein EDC59_11398 [Pseudodesulfovibrio indicus]
MSKIDRALQVRILEHLASFHPCEAPRGTWENLLDLAEGDERKLSSNMVYLEEHGMLVSGVRMSGDEPMVSVSAIRILHDGQDFLQKDGGLAVVKRTVTVRFHAECRDMIESCVNHSSLAPADKRSVLQALRELPASSIEHLTRILWEKAAENVPELLRLIGTHVL